MIPAITSAVHALGAQAHIGTPTAGEVTSLSQNSGSGSFGSALTNAIGSLESSQNTAASASNALATGTATDPTQAVTAVENASLAMDFASSIQNKLVTAANTIFATQV